MAGRESLFFSCKEKIEIALSKRKDQEIFFDQTSKTNK